MELAGTVWKLVGVETDGGTIPALPDAPTTLAFSEGPPSGRLSASGACNRYTAGYTLAEDRLSVSAMGSTRMLCDPERMAQEYRFFQALQAAERCELRDGELQIAYTGGTLRFMRATA